MPPIPPTKELLDAIDRRYPCRAVQLTQLSALVGDVGLPPPKIATRLWADLTEKNSIPSPPAIVLHGLEATGKTLVLRALLEATGTRHAWLACHECITARHLTERIGATFSAVLGIPSAVQQRCESASALAVYLQQILKREDGRKHFLVRSTCSDGGGGGKPALTALRDRCLIESTSSWNRLQRLLPR